MEYPTNPNQPKLPEPERVKKVVKGKEIKKSFLERFIGATFAEDIPSVKKFIFTQVFLPGASKLFSDIFVKGLTALFYGVNGAGTSYTANTGPTDYNSISTTRIVGSSNMTQAYKDSPDVTKRYAFKMVGYSTEQEAWDVLNQLRDDIRRYKRASLLSYYEYSDIDTESTENNWGWTNLDSPLADVYFDPSCKAWVIKLPKVQYLG